MQNRERYRGVAEVVHFKWLRPDREPRVRGSDQRSVDVIGYFSDGSLDSIYWDKGSQNWLLAASSQPILSYRELLAWTYSPQINVTQIMRALHGIRSLQAQN